MTGRRRVALAAALALAVLAAGCSTGSDDADDGTVKDVPADGSEPTDLARGEIDGKELPLYVRHERGVINRSVYDLASIDANPGDPRDDADDAAQEDEADPSDDYTGPGWNGKLLYRFGGGCGTTYGQGASSTNPLEPAFLRQGYAIATASFNTFQVQCNDVLSAETAMMVKERFVEAYGAPTFTIGEGASGGAIQLHLMTQNYPGIVNGVVAAMPFPDALSIAPGVTDCGLLLAYEETPEGSKLTEAQRQAIAGHASVGTCAAWKASFLGGIDPTDGCDPAIDTSLIYDPATNPRGLRCTLQDANRNQLDVDPETGFARRPLDNVGIQYGLEAFNAGIIDFDQFATLNEQIGGYDLDGNRIDQRHEADIDTVLHAYETGRISMGGGDQAEVPIIDLNLYLDPSGDIHDRFRAFSLRDRLVRGGSPEDAPGFQIWTVDPASTVGTDTGANPLTAGTLALDAVAVVDEWLTALIADDSGDPLQAVLARTRPDGAADRCVLDGAIESGVGIYDEPGPCRDDFPIAGDPRTAAGGPRANDIIKCTLKAIEPGDYTQPLTGEQLARLAAAFPTGVCDWDLPGEGQVVPASPDRSFEDVQTPQQDA